MDQKTIIIIVVAVVLLVAVYMYMRKRKEGYANVGDLDGIGVVNDRYEIIDAPEQVVDGQHFADMIDVSTGSSSNCGQTLEGRGGRPMQRLDRLQGSELLPRTSKGVTPFNIDIADPLAHAYMVNPPRVQLKDPIRIRSDFFRGDIPITYHPNVALVGKSQYGRDSLNLQGFFSPYQTSLYNKFTGSAFRNMPLKVVNSEILGDYQP
jgi:hypothetical protein